MDGKTDSTFLEDIYQDVDATTDVPGVLIWFQIFKKFPNAKVILLERTNGEEWLDSFLNLYNNMRDNSSVLHPLLVLLSRTYARFQVDFAKHIWMKLIGTEPYAPMNRDIAVSKYLAHSALVKELVPSSQLLVFNVKEGWDPLCSFLEKPVPEIPFPKKNAGTKKGQCITVVEDLVNWPIFKKINRELSRSFMILGSGLLVALGMGEEVVRSEVDDTWETRDDAQDELEVLKKHEEHVEHVDNDQNEPEIKTNINFEASLKHQSRENVCKPEEVSSNQKPTVAEIIKDNRERDESNWEVFTVSSPKNKMMFNLWLAGNRPSVIRSNAFGWICIILDSDYQSKYYQICFRILDAREYWKYMPNKNQNSLVDVARRFKVTLGKWMVQVPSEKVDEVWGLIATAIFNEDFGSAVLSAKVSPKGDENSVEDPNMHVICVYTSDFTNMEEVVKVENVLRNLGIRRDLNYKPDLYTSLGIYRGNPYKIRPSVYSSKMSFQASIFKNLITGESMRTSIKAERCIDAWTPRSRAKQSSGSSVKGIAMSPQEIENSQNSTESRSIANSQTSVRTKTSVNPQITETSKSTGNLQAMVNSQITKTSKSMMNSQITKASKSNIGNIPDTSSVNTQSTVHSNSTETPESTVNSNITESTVFSNITESTVYSNSTETPESTLHSNSTETPESTVHYNSTETPESTVHSNITESTVHSDSTETPESTVHYNSTETPERTVNSNITESSVHSNSTETPKSTVHSNITESTANSNSTETPESTVHYNSTETPESTEMNEKEVRESNAECRETVMQREDEDRWYGGRWHASSGWHAETKNSAEFWDAYRE
ncbi:uncharacterized protein LOC111710907 isoform X3 [Eurytemora carolleeae]|nr:uncharacterized protein LOC111710907 isoform X3 [Eurytemora carolleeae]|eukprot:XP_023340870.1 uncharacterized protein LOC111710907 isoform X3 [Eurytemora affinis]